MKIGVMGAGAVGCYHGTLLARAGHEITLVGRPAFVEQVRAAGLKLTSGGTTVTTKVHAASDASALAGSDIILCCVKSADTETAGRQLLAGGLRPDCVVLSLQNGVDNPQRLSAVLGRAVVPVVIYVGVEMVGPAHVNHLGRGQMIMGHFAGDAGVAREFTAAGISTEVSDDVVAVQWRKLTTNCAYNALSAITRQPYGPLMGIAGVPQVMRDVAAECIAVGRAAGVRMADLDMQAVLGLATTMPGQYSSTAQDLMRGRPTEIDYLNGYVVRRGDELGMPAPANRVLWSVVKALEAKPAATTAGV